MSETKTFRHQDYEMLCGAQAVDGNRFAPTLVVSKQAWPRRPRNIDVARGEYLTEDAAIEAAYAQGVEWIANYG
jgi:hypothetical protein